MSDTVDARRAGGRLVVCGYRREEAGSQPPLEFPAYRSTRLPVPRRPLVVVPVPGTLVELWQANAAGRYRHDGDRHPAPLDPNFSGAGRCLTDREGRFRFVTIKPGAYPWKNHHNAWRPAHIHFSLFGRAFTQRLIVQMYFPGDPLFPYDPILGSVPGQARERLVSRLDLDLTTPEWALGYRWDIVLRGREATPLEDEEDQA
jgi:protocatechuate 3,4-dioxygenase beta subunit